MALQKDSRLAWGISLLFFGFLFFVKQLMVFPPEISNVLFDFRNYPFILGAIFLLAHKNKNIGIVLLVVGVLFRLSDIIYFTRHISDFIWPSLLIIAGLIVIFGVKGKGK